MSNETLGANSSSTTPEVEHQGLPLPAFTEAHMSPEKEDGSFFFYYRHELSPSLQNSNYWSSLFSQEREGNVYAALYSDKLYWTDDQQCQGAKDLIKISEEQEASRPSVALAAVTYRPASLDKDVRLIDIWAGFWRKDTAMYLAKFIAANVTSDETRIRVVTINPQEAEEKNKYNTEFFGSLRRYRKQIMQAAE